MDNNRNPNQVQDNDRKNAAGTGQQTPRGGNDTRNNDSLNAGRDEDRRNNQSTAPNPDRDQVRKDAPKNPQDE